MTNEKTIKTIEEMAKKNTKKTTDTSELTTDQTFTSELETIPDVAILNLWNGHKMPFKSLRQRMRRRQQPRLTFNFFFDAERRFYSQPFVVLADTADLLEQVALDTLRKPCLGHLIQQYKSSQDSQMLYFVVSYRYYTNFWTDLKTEKRFYAIPNPKK